MTASDLKIQRVHRRSLGSLVVAQVFSGVGNGSALALGTLMAEETTGNTALAGTSTLAYSLAGVLLGIPLARFAEARGRRTALSTGLLVAAVGAFLMMMVPLWGYATLLVGSFLVGVGNAANLQARFAATDLASEERRGRDLSLVMWSVTVGAVLGPNLIGIGSKIGLAIGLPSLSGPFIFSLVGLLIGVLILQVGLRPDPLLLARLVVDRGRDVGHRNSPPRRDFRTGLRIIMQDRSAILAMLSVTVGHFVMVAVMSMTPVYMNGQADSLELIGLTISLHIAGMYALSPVMGWMSDKLGSVNTMVIGHLTLVAATLLAGFGRGDATLMVIGLILLGLGWSAAVVAGSALVSKSMDAEVRPLAQGSLDTAMSLAGVVGAGLSGAIMMLASYLGLNLVSGALSAVVVAVLLVRRTRA